MLETSARLLRLLSLLQSGRDWTADLDRCTACGSTALVKRLGEISCRDCGSTAGPAEGTAPAEEGEADDLGADVRDALDRLFGR